jgi:hypothetical protein
MNWMRTRIRRTIGALFLSLFIAASFLTTGGWFCADGRSCRPALSPTCCCGAEGAATEATGVTSSDGTSRASTLSHGECGCYRDAATTATLLPDVRPFATAPASLPGPGIFPPVSSRPLVSILTAEEFVPPPRFLISPRDTRAPPTA